MLSTCIHKYSHVNILPQGHREHRVKWLRTGFKGLKYNSLCPLWFTYLSFSHRPLRFFPHAAPDLKNMESSRGMFSFSPTSSFLTIDFIDKKY